MSDWSSLLYPRGRAEPLLYGCLHFYVDTTCVLIFHAHRSKGNLHYQACSCIGQNSFCPSLRFNPELHLTICAPKIHLVHYNPNPVSWWTTFTYLIFFQRKPFKIVKQICTLAYLVLKQTQLYSVLHYI